MSKRGNENSQLRPDEVERLNEESDEEQGTFKRASTEELATRRIVKARRPGQSDPKPQPAAAPPTSNPFANFSGFGAPSASVSAPSAPTTNPFANFGGLVAPSSAASTKESAPANPFSNFKGLVAPPAATPSAAAKPISFGSAPAATSKLVEELAESEHKKKMKKLNNSFLSWTSRQIESHPVTGWKDGVKDYIKYAKEINEKYPEDEDASSAPAVKSVVSSETVKAVVAAPIAEPVKTTPAPFLFPVTSAPTTAAPVPSADISAKFTFPTVTKAPEEKEKEKPASAAGAPLFFGGPQVSSFTSASPFTNPFTFNTTAPATTTTAAAPAASTSATTAFGGFGSSNFTFPTVSSFAAPAPAAAAGAGEEGGEEGGDDEGEPILEPEKVLKNENDTDDILLEVPCKLFNFNKESNEWKDTGKGTFRITQSITDKKQRMLVRNPIGKLTFNAGFYKTMKVDKVKGGVTFAALVVADEASVGGAKTTPVPELKKFMLKLKDVDIAVAQQKMEAAIAALP